MGRIESILIKNQYNQNDYITQGNLHIQCNSNSMQFKLLLAFFTELEPKKKFEWRHKRPKIAKTILRGKKMTLEESGSLTSDRTTKLQ